MKLATEDSSGEGTQDRLGKWIKLHRKTGAVPCSLVAWSLNCSLTALKSLAANADTFQLHGESCYLFLLWNKTHIRQCGVFCLADQWFVAVLSFLLFLYYR